MSGKYTDKKILSIAQQDTLQLQERLCLYLIVFINGSDHERLDPHITAPSFAIQLYKFHLEIVQPTISPTSEYNCLQTPIPRKRHQ